MTFRKLIDWFKTPIGTIVLGVTTAFFVLFLVTATPLSMYLPGYLDMNKRALVAESAWRIDSIAHESQLRSLYLDNLVAILSDKKSAPDNLARFDSAVGRLNDSILVASEREQAFVEHYENQERFGLNAIASKNQLSAVSFINAVKGKALVPDDPEDVDPLSGTRVQLQKEMPVLSPLESTVVLERFIVGNGHEVTLQCANDYIIILSHLSSVMIDEGKNLKAGQVVGHAGSQKDASERYINIRIWHKGKPVDPQTVMEFK